jgi:hypothetical protein
MYEDEPLVNRAEPKQQLPVPPAKEFEIEVNKIELEWVILYCQS